MSDEVKPSGTLVERLKRLLGRDESETKLRESLEETIEEIIEESEAPPAEISGQERILLRNVFKLRERTAYDVMIPRADIVAVKSDLTLAALVQVMGREAHSRYPVYRDTIDDVIGMVHIKDVLAYWGTDKPFRIDDVLRKVLFLAPSMRVLDMLLEMRRTRLHLALVVDEYGGVDGLISIENLVEAIVGEIEDEHDTDELPRLQMLSDGTALVDARLTLDEFVAEFGDILTPEEREADIDTVGGLAVSLVNRVPTRGEIVTHSTGLEFEVVDADPRRVKRLKVRRRGNAAVREIPSA
jgi:CBS domain containing-hemolysin-like protein